MYVKICEAAQEHIPDPVRPLLFTIARNLLGGSGSPWKHVVPIGPVADLDALGIVALEPLSLDRTVMARDEIRRLQIALDRLPPRCREAVILARRRRIVGQRNRNRAWALLSRLFPNTSHQWLCGGCIADMLYGEPTDHRRRV